MARRVPPRNLRFRLEVDGVRLAAFSELVIGTATPERVRHPRSTDSLPASRRTGVMKAGNVTLRQGVADSLELSAWHEKVATGQVTGIRRQVVIVVSDGNGTDVGRYVVRDAMPVKYQASDLNATGNEVAIESLELAAESIEPAP